MLNMSLDHVDLSNLKKTENQFEQIGDEEYEQAKRDASADSTGLVSFSGRFLKGVSGTVGVLAGFAKSGPEHSGQNEKEKVVRTQPPQTTWTQKPRGKSPDSQVSTWHNLYPYSKLYILSLTPAPERG